MAANSANSVSTVSSTASGSTTNPRKFSEKIALHRQKEAEERAEYEKIMSELKPLKASTSAASQQQQQQPQQQQQQTQRAHGNVMVQHHLPSPSRHLSPPTFNNSNIPRPLHASLPNVNAAMALQSAGVQSVLSTDELPLVIGGSSVGGGSGLQGGGLGRGPGHGSGGHASIKDSMGSTGPIRSHKSRIDTSPYGSERYGSGTNYHLSPPDPSWRRVRSDSSLHQSVQGATGAATGNIPTMVNQNGLISPLQGASPTLVRRDGRVMSAGSQRTHHSPGPDLSPHHHMDQISNFLLQPTTDKDDSYNRQPGSLPDLSNFHVNPAAVTVSTSVNNYEYPDDQGSPYSTSPVNNWSPAGTVPNSPHSPLDSCVSGAAVSAPINMNRVPHLSSAGTSPTSGHHMQQQQHHQHHHQQQQVFFPGGSCSPLSSQYQQQLQQQQRHQSNSPLPSPITSSHQHQQQQQHHQLHQRLCSVSSTSSSSCPTTVVTSSSSSIGVRLSDNQISEILSIPVNMVTDDDIVMPTSPTSPSSTTSAVTVSNHQHLQHSPTSPAAANASRFGFCDTNNASKTERNLLHMNKGLAIDQSLPSRMAKPRGVYLFPKSDRSDTLAPHMDAMNSYRNPQAIPGSNSPGHHMQGSPSARSTSPIDIAGSPNSPNGPLSTSPNQSPGICGGFGANMGLPHELSQEFQKFTMVENPASASASSSLFFQDVIGGFDTQNQPISDLTSILSTSQHNDDVKTNTLSGNGGSMAPQTPQTPSSIPDIILTDADDSCSEAALQRALGMSFDNPNDVMNSLSQEISANFSDLGKLDESMLRLLTEGVTMDQQIADPMTEEHLKL